MTTLVFVVLLAAAITFFARTVWVFGRAVATGVPDPRPRTDQLPARLASVLIYFFAQKKVAEEGPSHRTSKHHLFIFWGFLIITIATVDLLVSGVVPSLAMHRWMPAMLFKPLYTIIDVFNLIVLAMVTWAVIRRVFVRPALIPMTLDAGLILGAIGSLMLTHFLFHGYEVAHARAIGAAAPAGMPLSTALGDWMAPLSAEVAHRGATINYWLHVLILLTFLNYLPYSKHIHLLGALPNIFARNLSTRTLDLPKVNLEDEKQWGVGDYQQFSWKSLLDTYACTECARCSNYCPAYGTGKNLSPMQLVHDIRYEMLDRVALGDRLTQLEGELASITEYAARSGLDQPGHEHPDLLAARAALTAAKQQSTDMPRLTGGRIAEDTLWACTAKSTLAARSTATMARVCLTMRASNAPAQPTHSRYSGLG